MIGILLDPTIEWANMDHPFGGAFPKYVTSGGPNYRFLVWSDDQVGGVAFHGVSWIGRLDEFFYQAFELDEPDVAGVRSFVQVARSSPVVERMKGVDGLGREFKHFRLLGGGSLELEVVCTEDPEFVVFQSEADAEAWAREPIEDLKKRPSLLARLSGADR